MAELMPPRPSLATNVDARIVTKQRAPCAVRFRLSSAANGTEFVGLKSGIAFNYNDMSKKYIPVLQ
jgi:hypothetical protein